MTERAAVIRDLLARARTTGKRVFGFSSAKASCAELGARVKVLPEDWDWACVEGDRTWTWLPEKEPEPVKE